jgi:ATPase subunit of ABC transporter with duplicated ATPase domains
MLLQATNISFGYTDIPLFKNATFSINAGDRIGLVGDNGAGKSTLLKCLMGLEEIHTGQIIRPKTLGKVAYVPQSLPADLKNKTFAEFLLEAIPQEERDYSGWKVDIAMNEIGVPDEIREFPLAHLSGGWQRMALLIRANLDEPDLILMDEPTNYLDLDKIFKLENWLKNTVKAPFLAVSHDRKFLDNCTNKTMHIRGGELMFHNVPYSHAREVLLEEDIVAAKNRELEEEEIDRLRAAAKRIRIWSAGRNGKLDRQATTLFARADKLDSKKTDVYKATRRDIDFNPDEIRPKTLLNIKNTQVVAPDGRPLFKIPEMSVVRGERVAILAMNGVGKTQMIEALMRAYKEPVNNKAAGEMMQFNPQVNIGYIDQHVSMLPMKKSMADYIIDMGKTMQEATKLLIVAGFPYKNHTQIIETLSQGERARLAFLGLKVGRHNFFIMDEPTNHIDIDGQEKFEDAVISEEQTCVFVSHDRYMMEQVANKYYQVKNGVLRQVDSVEPFYEEMKAIKDNFVQQVNQSGKKK